MPSIESRIETVEYLLSKVLEELASKEKNDFHPWSQLDNKTEFEKVTMGFLGRVPTHLKELEK